MKKYFKLYHYSNNINIKEIDPSYYGTGVTQGAECKRGKTGLNKSYYYTKDEPEPSLSFRHRYEVYLPYKWKDAIYDLGEDRLDLYSVVKNKLTLLKERIPYQYELTEALEQEVKDVGYKGWKYERFAQLPHVVLLFYKLSTEKPKENYIAYDWKGNEIERNEQPQSLPFFSNTGCANQNTFEEPKRLMIL